MSEVPLYPMSRYASRVRARYRFRAKRELLERFEDFDLKAKARTWPGLSCVNHIRSTGVLQEATVGGAAGAPNASDRVAQLSSKVGTNTPVKASFWP